MKKIFITFMALLLVAIMLVTLLVSCKDPGDDPTDTNNTDTTDDVSAGPGETKPTSGVPEGVTFEGEEVHWLVWSDITMLEFYAEDVTGDDINDAIYERNKDIQKQYGVTFIYSESKGSGSHLDEYEKKIQMDFNGDQAYEIIAAYSQLPITLSMRGYLGNMKDMRYLDFSKPWWPENMVEQATINNNLYFCAGDISTNMLWMMTVMYFNKDLAENYQIENIYSLVDNYEWTQEKLLELTTDIYTDKNEDGKKDANDLYGLGISGVNLDSFGTASGVLAVVKDKQTDLFAVNSDYFGEKMVNAIDLGLKLLESNGTKYHSSTNAATRVHFSDGSTVFWPDRVFAGAREFQAEGVDVTFGIVPIPQYSADQKQYYTNLGHPFSLYCVSSNVIEEERKDKISAVLQEMAFRSYQDVTPEVFDTTLKNRYAHEPDDARMLDLIKDSVVFEMGRFLNQAIGTVATNGYRTTVVGGQNTWSSTSRKNLRSLGLELQDVNELWSKSE